MSVASVNPGSTITLSGRFVDFVSPDSSSFNISDIACGLSKICRYAGQTSEFYSVAEHSFHLSLLVGNDPVTQLCALLDDGSEAYLGDLPAPVIELPEMAPLRLLHRRVSASIRERFGLPFLVPNIVSEMDLAMRLNEQVHLRGLKLQRGQKLLPFSLACWDHKGAETMFLERFQTLIDQIGAYKK